MAKIIMIFISKLRSSLIRNTIISVAFLLMMISCAKTSATPSIDYAPELIHPPDLLSISDISDNRADYSGAQIPLYKKFEISFQVQNTIAHNFQLPYDPAMPAGLDPSYPGHQGISVDAYFLPPGTNDWSQAYKQPAFYYEYIDSQGIKGSDSRNLEWNSPVGSFAWKVRFSPNQTGTWQFRVAAQDAGGSFQTGPQSFSVTNSEIPGFIKVSPSDPRYFEFDNGDPYFAIGFQGHSYDPPIQNIDPNFEVYNQFGINLSRNWISGMFGASWLEWLGGRNLYDGYLPRSGIEPFHDPIRNQDILTMRMDYTSGDSGWYDACRFQFWNTPEAVKPHTNYRLQIQYWGKNITGPRILNAGTYGLVGKIGGGWETNCDEPGTSNLITNYGGTSSDWRTIEGTWNSGENYFLPRVYLGLENVNQGTAYIRSISLRENLGYGQYGPEILIEPSLEYELYFPEQSAFALDKVISKAEQTGVYLKFVIMEKNDSIYYKLDDDGTFVINGERDNQDGFYGLGREMNKTRWLQQAWWRYLQARWGYSIAIHSWELTNEGDPGSVKHWELADELGKYMHCQVFGVLVGSGNGVKCNYDHPNDHLVTTSFWHSFPAKKFWGSRVYPNVDYADVHAYISTGWRRNSVYETDAALFHLEYSTEVRESLDHYSAQNGIPTKPIVRGEIGIDVLGKQTEQSDLALDKTGVWLHNLTWSQLDPGAMMELYWWTDNIHSQPGPDGNPGLYEVYGYFYDFIKDIPINNGHYVDIAAQVSNQNLRVVGQKDTINDRAHLWAQNKNHTWRNVVDGVANINGLSGTVTLKGFSPNRTFTVQWVEFTTQGIPNMQTSTIVSDDSGNLVLYLPTDVRISDVGIKIGDYP